MKLNRNGGFTRLIFGLSTKSLETLAVASVRPYLGNRSLLFFVKLQLVCETTVRACKREKNVPSAFLIMFTVLAVFVKKLAKFGL